jgi:hypothetical protein
MKMAVTLMAVLLAQTALAQVQRLDALHGEPITIKPSVPPTGVELFQILLENATMPLQGNQCIDEKESPLTLQHQLALMLGEGLNDKRHKTNLAAKCQADGIEVSGKALDIWRCEINVTETTKKGSYVANSVTRIGLTKDTWQIVPGSLQCL